MTTYPRAQAEKPKPMIRVFHPNGYLTIYRRELCPEFDGDQDDAGHAWLRWHSGRSYHSRAMCGCCQRKPAT